MGDTPELTIRDYLAEPETNIVSQQAVGGWRGQTSSGGFNAAPDSFTFGSMRELGDRRVYAVTFATRAGARMRVICHVRRAATGDWRCEGVAGGGVGGDPHRGQPWVNFCGSYGREFYAGGQVLEHGGAVARVRMVGANGYALEDAPGEVDIVLFLADDPTHAAAGRVAGLRGQDPGEG
ncbi:MAG TPA: hypothetical protein VF808_06485 [Ktedonobacterales bacterium]